ncbi:MAG: hypothetical protein D6818_08730 [Bacteroidetes bacterium]|nr:MAG: hypothetical protein D6818_08730 [Bacteroidota bacterium]
MIRLLFFCALALLLLTGLLWWLPPLSDATGGTHPDYATLLHSRTDLPHQTWWWLGGLAWGTFIIGTLAATLLLATRPGGRTTPFTRLTGLAMLLYWLCFLAMMVAWRAGWQAHVLGFPLPTALMLYGLWGIPLLITWAHYRYYDRWVLRPDQLERFREMTRVRRDGETE